MSDDNSLKKIFFCIGIACFIPVFIMSIIVINKWVDEKNEERIKASNTRTIGTIFKVSVYEVQERSQMIKAFAEYIVNGKRYVRREYSGKIPNPPLGAHFEIMYDQEHPADSRIDFAKPVFLKEDVTDTTTCILFGADSNFGYFSYIVNGKEYNGSQVLAKWQRISYEGPCTVEYLVRDPRISIMKL